MFDIKTLASTFSLSLIQINCFDSHVASLRGCSQYYTECFYCYAECLVNVPSVVMPNVVAPFKNYLSWFERAGDDPIKLFE
jgi:hypothetical protein